MPIAVYLTANPARLCECGAVACYQAAIEIISADGCRRRDCLNLCQACYVLYLEDELDNCRRRPPRASADLKPVASLIRRHVNLVLRQRNIDDRTRRQHLRDAQLALSLIEEINRGN